MKMKLNQVDAQTTPQVDSNGVNLSHFSFHRRWLRVGILAVGAAFGRAPRQSLGVDRGTDHNPPGVTQLDGVATHPDKWDVVKNTPRALKEAARASSRRELERVGGNINHIEPARVARDLRAQVSKLLTEYGNAIKEIYDESDKQLASERTLVRLGSEAASRLAPSGPAKVGASLVNRLGKNVNKSLDQSIKNTKTRIDAYRQYLMDLSDAQLLEYFDIRSTGDLSLLLFENTRIRGLDPFSREGVKTHLLGQVTAVAETACDLLGSPKQSLPCRAIVNGATKSLERRLQRNETAPYLGPSTLSHGSLEHVEIAHPAGPTPHQGTPRVDSQVEKHSPTPRCAVKEVRSKSVEPSLTPEVTGGDFIQRSCPTRGEQVEVLGQDGTKVTETVVQKGCVSARKIEVVEPDGTKSAEIQDSRSGSPRQKGSPLSLEKGKQLLSAGRVILSGKVTKGCPPCSDGTPSCSGKPEQDKSRDSHDRNTGLGGSDLYHDPSDKARRNDSGAMMS